VSDEELSRIDLEERTYLLRLLQQAPGFFCYLRGPELVFEFANDAYLRLVGRHVLGKPLREALPELVGQGYLELLEKIFRSKEPFVGRKMAVRLQRHENAALEQAFVDFIYQPVLEQGSVVGILVQGHDVTETHRQQLERLAAEERYRRLFESIDDGFCIMQLVFDAHDRPIDYRFLEANSAFEEHTGLRNVVGKTALELVPDLDESWFRLYGEVALSGRAARFENHAPAMRRWFDVYASRVGKPELRQVALVFKNITVQKHAELVLKESEARFRNMADHAPVMLWVTDFTGGCVYLNRKWCAFTGQSLDAGLGKGWLAALHPDDAAHRTRSLAAVSSEQGALEVEYRLRRHDGCYVWVLEASSPRFDESGAFLGYVGSVTDISDRKQNEERRESLLKLEQAGRSRAEEASRVKDEFLAMLSHELRTPLSAVLGWVRMLRTGMVQGEKREQALETIERNARAQVQLIEDLLDVSRILSGKLKLEIEPVNVDMVVAQAIETVRPAAEAKAVRLQAALDSNCLIMADATRLEQVVWNLLANAVKFTPKQGRVMVTVVRVDSSVQLTVSDTGQGVPSSFLPHVFERFSQAEGGPSRRAGGLGLGLSIVKHVVEAHGGTVAVFSEGEGKGSEFVVRIPLSPATRRETTRTSNPPNPNATTWDCPPELAGIHVLVVDDERDAREMLSNLLEACKARVTTAGSAREALAVLKAQQPDILVSDIGMPEQDGFALIKQVRALEGGSAARLPAIALTAYARVEDRTRVLLAGFQTHVRKPVEPVELLAVIASLLGRSTH
jgi:PAS domain S-box-containing protein